MRKTICNNAMLTRAMSALVGVVLIVTAAQADSLYLTAADGYRVDDCYSQTEGIDAFGMIDDHTLLVSKVGSDLRIVNLETSAVTSLGQPQDSYYMDNYDEVEEDFKLWTSFVEKSPIDGSYWIGFTNWGNTDDRIYQVSPGGTWTPKGTFTGNYDLEFYGENLLVSSNLDGMDGPDNQIYKLDTSGGNNHRAIAITGGYSAGLGVSSAGIHYATTFASSEGLYFFPDADIQDALAGGPAVPLPEESLTPTTRGAFDTEVDAGGHAIFDMSDFYEVEDSEVCLYDGSTPGTLTTIAISETATSLKGIEVEGDLLSPGGFAYVATEGIAKITKLLPGDANGDGAVDTDDSTIMVANWLQSGSEMSWSDGDFNGDDKVDTDDSTLLVANWLRSLDDMPGSSGMGIVPEPSTMALLFTMLAAGLFTKRLRAVRR